MRLRRRIAEQIAREIALAFLEVMQPPVPHWFTRWLPFLCAGPTERAEFDRLRSRRR